MKRSIINILLLGILLIQVLPIQEMGELWFSNQLNEEVVNTDAMVKEVNKAGDSIVEFNESQSHALIYTENQPTQYFGFQDMIPLHHISDVPVPPPNKMRA